MQKRFKLYAMTVVLTLASVASPNLFGITPKTQAILATSVFVASLVIFIPSTVGFAVIEHGPKEWACRGDDRKLCCDSTCRLVQSFDQCAGAEYMQCGSQSNDHQYAPRYRPVGKAYLLWQLGIAGIIMGGIATACSGMWTVGAWMKYAKKGTVLLTSSGGPQGAVRAAKEASARGSPFSC